MKTEELKEAVEKVEAMPEELVLNTEKVLACFVRKVLDCKGWPEKQEPKDPCTGCERKNPRCHADCELYDEACDATAGNNMLDECKIASMKFDLTEAELVKHIHVHGVVMSSDNAISLAKSIHAAQKGKRK